MTKSEFIAELKRGICGLPQADIEERLLFYSEMIDDRIEEGLSEEEAVADVGSVDMIVSQIISETPLTRLARERIKPKRRMRAWEIVLLVLGSPVWVPLLAAAFVIIASAFVVLASLVISAWAIFAAFVGVAVGGLAGSVLIIIRGNVFSGVAVIGAALFFAGLSIFLFFGCRAATMGIAKLIKMTVLGIKKLFVGRKENA